MNKILKYGLITIGGLALLLMAAAAYVAATFNPNDYKPQIQQLVKDKLDRTLKIGGDIKLAFYPTLGADLVGVSLSEAKSEKEFAAIDSARIALQLMPLLSKQLVVNRIEVHGLRANLVKHKNGTTNIDDLMGKDKPPPAKAPAGDAQAPMQFNIDHVLIDNAKLSYLDEGSGARYAVAKLSLKTGKLALGTPADIDLVAQGLSAPQSKANLDARMKTRLDWHADSQRFKLDNLDLDVKGEAAGFNPLTLSLKGAIEGDAKQVRSNEITVDVDGRQGERTLKAKLVSPLTADLEAKRFALPKLTATIGSTNAKSTGAPLSLNLTGAAQVDLPKQSASLDFVTKLDESTIRGKAGVSDFDPLSYVFDVAIDTLDVDRYTGAKPASTKAAEGEKGAAPKPEEPLDFSALKGLNARGSLKIGALKASNLRLQNARIDLKAANGRVDLNPLAASLYQGSMNGSLSLMASAAPQISLKQSLSGISIGPLLRDLTGKDLLEGRGNVTVDVSGQGKTATAIKQALDGTAALNLTDGALKGYDIGAALRTAKEKLASVKGEAPAQAARPTEKTDFSELKASFKINNGVAHNSDLSLKSPLLRVGGEGNVNIGNDSMDYLAKATLVATTKGQGGKSAADLQGLTVPVRISGPFSSLSYKLDVNAMISGVAQQKIEEKKEELKSRVEDKIKDRLKGLFGR
jgi:AsmA protein